MAFTLACSDIAPTVPPTIVRTTNPTDDSGIIYPQIQLVVPGGLQTLTAPQAVDTGISPNNPGIVLVFTREIENDGGEMYFSIELLQGAVNLPFTLNPAGASSFSFNLIPLGALSENTNYVIRIYNSAYENGFPSTTLVFDNLGSVGNPLNPLNPSYVEYEFQTGSETPADQIAPTLQSTTPVDLAVGVAVDLNPNGYIQFVMNDAVSPMIDPTTVNSASVTLYNVTDSLAVSGAVFLDPTVANLSTYRFYPDSMLEYGTNYRLNVSVGDAITDMSGNALAYDSVTFTTAPEGDPAVSDYEITAVTSTSATITWSTSRASIKHIELDDAAAFVAATVTVHDTTLADTFSETVAGLTPNTLYSIRLAADNETTTPVGGPFDATQTFNAVFRTLPDTAEGASGNFQLAVNNNAKSNIRLVQNNQDESYMFWLDSSGEVRGQFIDSAAGASDTWDKWPTTAANTGVQVFSSGGNDVRAIAGTFGSVVVARIDNAAGEIYAASVYDSGGTLAFDWGSGGTGITAFDNGGTAISHVRAAITYSGYVAEITSGTVDRNVIYDSSIDFSTLAPALDPGDHVINQATLTGHTTITSIDGINLLVLLASIITSANRQYRIGDDDVQESDTASANAVGATIFYNNGLFDQTDIVTNSTNYSYLTGPAIWLGGSPWYSQATAINSGFLNTEALITYDYIANGTMETNFLFDNGINFSTVGPLGTGILVNDIVFHSNVSGSAEYDKAVSVYGANTNLLLLSDPAKYLFDTAADQYQILRLPDHTTFVTSGLSTATGALTMTEAGRSFMVEGVLAGDVVYNLTTNRYTETTAVAATTITMASQIFGGAGENYIILRYKGITFVWAQAGDIRGRTIDANTGALMDTNALTNALIDPGTVAGNFIVSPSGVNAKQNPFIVSGVEGNAIVVYEAQMGGNINIFAKKVTGSGQVVWGLAGDGTSIVANAARDDLIQKVLPDGNGGVWVLYTSHDATTKRSGVAHISNAGVPTVLPILTDADHPDMTAITAANIAVAYEVLTVVATETVPRIFVQRYINTPAVVGGAINVRSANQAIAQLNPHIASDGNVGAMVSWFEMKYAPSMAYAIFGQHFTNFAPTRQWGDDYFVGIPVLDSLTGVNIYTAIEHGIFRWNDAAAPNSGVLYWLDQRGTGTDIYFQNVND